MSAALLIGCFILALIGVHVALIAWLALRLTVGGFWAILGLQVLLATTIFGILSLIP